MEMMNSPEAVIETGRQRRSLAEVSAQLDHQDATVDCSDLFQQLVGAVAGTVVHQDEFKRIANLLHDLFQARIKGGNVLFFVMEGNNNGKLRHSQ